MYYAFSQQNQRDWSKFNVKKHRFDPKTFQPFDKVLVKGAMKVIMCGFLTSLVCHLMMLIKLFSV